MKDTEIAVMAPEEAIFLTMLALLSPGDHVICTFPGYQSLYQVRLASTGAAHPGCHKLLSAAPGPGQNSAAGRLKGCKRHIANEISRTQLNCKSLTKPSTLFPTTHVIHRAGITVYEQPWPGSENLTPKCRFKSVRCRSQNPAGAA